MSHPIWSGSISFGLINIPVRLHSGTKEHRVHLDMLHNKDLSPIRYAKVCTEEEKEVPFNEVVKGYEYQKGRYVVVTDADFENVNPKKSMTMELICFTDEKCIDSIYFDTPYFLEPDKGAAKVYRLLHGSMKETGLIGITSFVMHGKEHLAMIKPSSHAIILQTLRFQTELRDWRALELPLSAKISAKEKAMAIDLIKKFSKPFKPESFKDTYAIEFDRMIRKKVKHDKPHARHSHRRALRR